MEPDPAVVARLRGICLALPETYEEEAWVGVRWCVRRKTFAHVLTVDPERQRAHARAAAVDHPIDVVTFRAPAGELAAMRQAGFPFFYAGWGRDVVGMVLTPKTDWDEVAELLTDSYRVLAPKKLGAQLDGS